MTSYVIRLTDPETGDQFKVFRSLSDAKDALDTAAVLVWDDELIAAALFEVPINDNPRAAVEAVKTGNATILAKDRVSDLRQRTYNWLLQNGLPSRSRTKE